MTLQDNNEYTITLDDILNNSEFSDTELTDVFGANIDYHLINISKKTYRAMYSAYNGWNMNQQRLEMQEMINDNEDKQQVMLEAIIEYIRGAMYSGMDMNIYMGDKGHSQDVIDILRIGDLWYPAEIKADSDIIAT